MNTRAKNTLLSALFYLFMGIVVLTLPVRADEPNDISYKTVTIENVDIFYREAGPKNAPTILLLHGFPTSSQMFRNLIPALAERYHVVAPDYPGFGNSAMPGVDKFDSSFDNLAPVI